MASRGATCASYRGARGNVLLSASFALWALVVCGASATTTCVLPDAESTCANLDVASNGMIGTLGHFLLAADGSLTAAMCAQLPTSIGTFGCVLMLNTADSPSGSRCGTDGEQIRCPPGSLVRGLCSGSNCGQCVGGAGAPAVVAIDCGVVDGVQMDPSTSAWRYGPSGATCNRQHEVLTGLCASMEPASVACGGFRSGVLCTRFTADRPLLSRSPSLSATASLTATVTTSLLVTDTRALRPTATERQTPTDSFSHALHPTPTSVSLSPTVSRSMPRRPTRTPSATATSPTRSFTYVPPRTKSATLTPPSRTPQQTTTPSQTPLLPFSLQVLTTVDIAAVHSANTTAIIEITSASGDVGGAVSWARDYAPFILQNMQGSDSRNPFGFDGRLEALVGDASVDDSGRRLLLKFRRDTCYEPSSPSGETVSISFPAKAFVPPRAGVVVQLEFRQPVTVTREVVGLVIVIALLLLALASMVWGNVALGLHNIWCAQGLVLLTTNACSRLSVARYVRFSFWLAKSTLRSNLFSSSNDELGVVVAHLLMAGPPLLLHYWLARKFIRLRVTFPVVPVTVMSLLYQGAVHAGWFVVLSAEAKVVHRFFAFLFMLLFVGCLIVLVERRLQSFQGLTFMKYQAGMPRRIFHGEWQPRHLRIKYAAIVDAWSPEFPRGPFAINIGLWGLTAALAAVEPSSFPGCIALFGTIMTLHGLSLLVFLYIQPGRSVPITILCLMQSGCVLMGLIGVVSALDCSARYPDNVRGGEGLIVTALVVLALCSMLHLVLALLEKRFHKSMKKEVQEMRGVAASSSASPLSLRPQDRDAEQVASLRHFEVRETMATDPAVEKMQLEHQSLPPLPRVDVGGFEVEVKPRALRGDRDAVFFEGDAGREQTVRGQPTTLLLQTPYFVAPMELHAAVSEEEVEGARQSVAAASPPRHRLLGSLQPGTYCPRCRRFTGRGNPCAICAVPHNGGGRSTAALLSPIARSGSASVGSSMTLMTPSPNGHPNHRDPN